MVPSWAMKAEKQFLLCAVCSKPGAPESHRNGQCSLGLVEGRKQSFTEAGAPSKFPDESM